MINAEQMWDEWRWTVCWAQWQFDIQQMEKWEQFEYLEDSTSENTKQKGQWNCLSSLGRNKCLMK